MITLQTKKHVYNMGSEEFARWMCLMEAFHYIAKKSEELNIKDEDIKPLAIERYIQERFPAMHHDIMMEFGEYF